MAITFLKPSKNKFRPVLTLMCWAQNDSTDGLVLATFKRLFLTNRTKFLSGKNPVFVVVILYCFSILN